MANPPMRLWSINKGCQECCVEEDSEARSGHNEKEGYGYHRHRRGIQQKVAVCVQQIRHSFSSMSLKPGNITK